jgi:hypothetical protein
MLAQLQFTSVVREYGAFCQSLLPDVLRIRAPPPPEPPSGFPSSTIPTNSTSLC